MTRNNESFVPVHEIVRALVNDPVLQFKDRGSYLQEGVCPSCGKKELYVSKEKPWIIDCNRKNRCGANFKVNELVPELFTNFAERYKPTEKEPNKTADVYLSMTRNFDLSKIRGWYEQAACQLPNTNTYCTTVRFYLDKERTRYWERLIDKTDKAGKKAHFGGRRRPDGKVYKGEAWTPPKQKLEDGDKCFIVEGIFHAIALHHHGIKAAAAFSCNNFPSELIEQHKDKDITWVLALDGDTAGKKGIRKHVEKLKELELKYEVVLLPDGKEDWDDLHKHGKITIDGELSKNIFLWGRYRGEMLLADTEVEKGYVHYKYKQRSTDFIITHDNYMFRVWVDSEFEDALIEEALKGNDSEDPEEEDLLKRKFLLSQRGFEFFEKNANFKLICNVYPEFIFHETDELMEDKQFYVFKVNFKNRPPKTIRLDARDLESASAFCKALNGKTPGADFDGEQKEFKKLKKKWMIAAQGKSIRSIDYYGYVEDINAYIFKDYAYFRGKQIARHEDGYYQIGSEMVRPHLSGLNIATDNSFSNDWLDSYQQVFSFPGMALLGFWLGSLFVQQIRKKQGDFPFFEFTGEPGAGKSTALYFLWRLLGRDDHEGFDALKSTKAGRRRAFSNLSNMPTVLIESDRDDGTDRGYGKSQFNFDEFKPFYNGGGTGITAVKNHGNEIKEPKFKSSLVISQNAEVNASTATLQRIVHCHVDKAHHSHETIKLARWFTVQSVEDVGGFMKAALMAEQQILKKYYDEFDRLEPFFLSHIKENSRIAKTHAQVAACCSALSVLFPQLNQSRVGEITDYLLERAKARIVRLSADHPIVEQFWDAFHYLNEEAAFREEGRLNHSTDPAVIAISIPEFLSIAQRESMSFHKNELLNLLPTSRRHKLICKNVSRKSRWTGKNIRRWEFMK